MKIRSCRRWLFSVIGLMMVTACSDGGSSGGSGGSSDGGDQEPTVDTTPSSFNFSDQSGVEPNTMVESDSIVITGIDPDAVVDVSVAGGELSINGGDYTSASGTVEAGDSITLRVRSADEHSSTVEATLVVGVVSDAFRVTTLTPLLTTVRVEAENATLLGGSELVADPQASASAAAGSILSTGSGVSVTVPQNTARLTIGYSGTDAANLTVAAADGSKSTELSLESTAALDVYSEVWLDVEHEEGRELEIVLTDDADVRLDYIDFEPTPFQVVETLADLGQSLGDGVATDSDGNIFIAGHTAGNILRVTPAGEVSTFASGFSSVNGLDFDSEGNLFACVNGSLYKFDDSGSGSLFGGSGLSGLTSVWVDENDTIYASAWDSGEGDAVYAFTPAGSQSVHAQGGGLSSTIGVTGDEQGNIWVGNWFSGNVYEVGSGGVTELADTAANINQMAYNRGYLYVPVVNQNRIIRIRVSDGQIFSFAGSGDNSSTDGHVLDASFSAPNSLGFSPDGSIMYVLDSGTGSLRKIHVGNPE